MRKEERDPHSGYLTTGHEWSGIRELNTPVPRVVYLFLILAAVFAVGYWILMPAWPIGTTYTKGLLGVDQRTTVAAKLNQAALGRSVWTRRIESESFDTIQADPRLMQAVRQTGRTLFGDNCAACHGRDARGGIGFPNLTAAPFLWGSGPQTIADTIRVGINSSNTDSRVSQMPAFGRDQLLKRDEILDVVAYVKSLSDLTSSTSADRIAAGKTVFAANCASCHNDDAKGKVDTGAPNLTDAVWLYGSDPATIFTTVWDGRQGHMPSWEQRLSSVERKILTLYLVDLRSGR